MSNVESGTGGEQPDEPLPTWDDEYIERVAGRLASHYDLERDRRVEGEQFTLYGEMVIENKKHFLHPSIEIGNHRSYEHLFARRREQVTTAELDRLVDLGHDLADDRVDPDEEHYSTEFTFVTITGEIPDAVRSMVRDLDERTLLKYGYNGHYEINLVVVVPGKNEIVTNDSADVKEAFQTWDDIEHEEPGLLRLIARRFQL